MIGKGFGLAAALRLAWWMARGSHARLWLLIACIAIGVSARVGVGSLTALVTRTMAQEARPLLGADLEISSYQPLSSGQREQLERALPVGAHLQEHEAFVTMAEAPVSGKATAVEVRAIPVGYPLVGVVSIVPPGLVPATSPQSALFAGVPAVYVERSLLGRLGLDLGGLLRLGKTTFRIAGVLIDEPGLGQNPFAIGPSVLMPRDAVTATGLSADGARIRHVIMVTTRQPDQTITLEAQLRSDWGLKDVPGSASAVRPVSELTPSIRSALKAQDSLARSFERLADYLHLVTVIALLLGGLGVALLMHGFMEHHRDSIATAQMLGATTPIIAVVFLIYAGAVGLIGGALGVVAGLAGANAAVPLLATGLPMARGVFLDVEQTVWGLALAGVVSVTSAAFPLIAFSRSKPQARIRSEITGRLPWLIMTALGTVAVALVGGIAVIESGSGTVGIAFTLGVVGGVFLIYGLGKIGIRLVSWIRPRSFKVRHGLANLGRAGVGTASAILAIGISTLLFAVLAIYQDSLAGELTVHAQVDLPSLFLIDIPSEQSNEVRALLAHDFAITAVDMQPRVRGRLRGVIRTTAPGADPDPGPGPRNREQNLSWRSHPGAQERIIAGRWMDDSSPNVEASLEQRYAANLGARLGDTLRFDVQGVQIDATVTSIREVHWTSFQPNFFVLLSPHALQDAPQTWVAALPALAATRREQVVASLAQRFPSITVFDVSEIAGRINDILQRIVTAVRLVALSCVAAGLVVLAGLAISSARVRRADAALLKLLGADHATLLVSLASELLAGGVLAAVIGCSLAIPIGWIVMHLLTFPLVLPWSQLGLILGASILVYVLGGMISCVTVLLTKPLAVLREE